MIKNHKLNFFHRKNGAGFTLIELLVVIAVIGLLASIIGVSLNSARVKARDASRHATLKQLHTALGLYYDKYGVYPVITENECGGTEGYTVVSNNFMQPLVTEGFIASYPTDPGKINCNIQYVNTTDQQGYVIFVHWESQASYGCNGNAPYWSCEGINPNPGW